MDSKSADGPERPTEGLPGKKPYSAPVLVTWGTLRDITQSAGFQGAQDGGKKKRPRTR